MIKTAIKGVFDRTQEFLSNRQLIPIDSSNGAQMEPQLASTAKIDLKVRVVALAVFSVMCFAVGYFFQPIAKVTPLFVQGIYHQLIYLNIVGI